jgi:hypothetical protein
MAIAFANLGSSANPDINNSANQSSYSNSSWTPPTDGLIVVFVDGRDSDFVTPPATPTVSGNSLTWVQIGSTYDCETGTGTYAHGISLFAADASDATTGVTTINFGEEQVHCVASFFQVTGADISSGVAAAFVQNQQNKASSGTEGSVTLNSPGDNSNRPIVFFWHYVIEATTPRTNWTEIDDFEGAGHDRGAESQWRTDAFETTASATWTTSNNWAGFAAEIKADLGNIEINVSPDDIAYYTQGIRVR